MYDNVPILVVSNTYFKDWTKTARKHLLSKPNDDKTICGVNKPIKGWLTGSKISKYPFCQKCERIINRGEYLEWKKI